MEEDWVGENGRKCREGFGQEDVGWWRGKIHVGKVFSEATRISNSILSLFPFHIYERERESSFLEKVDGRYQQPYP